MQKHILKEIIIQQNKKSIDKTLIERTDFDFISKLPQIVVLSGIRRCGKSTLMSQIRQTSHEKDFYLNFDDERLLHFEADDFQLLHETFIELYGEQTHFYFDEIQNIPNWEGFIRRLHNDGNKIFITGSNANLLSKELGTYLTGRHIQATLYPFSFKEYMKYNHIEILEEDYYTTNGKAKLKIAYQNYFVDGGFPEYLETKNTEQLKSLYNSILYRDIIVRNNINNEMSLRELGYFMAGNIGKPISYSKLSGILSVKHGQTVKNYVSNFEDTYLVFQLSKFDFSIKKQLANPKKIYFIDNALARSVSFRFSDDRGRFLENIVFLELKRKRFELFYHKEKKECDFIITENRKVTQAIQVSVSIDDEQTKKREIAGLLDALEFHQLKSGLLITEEEEGELQINGKTILIKPIWKWLLE